MIAILEYGEGNTCSVQHALNRLSAESVLTADPAVLKAADKVIFPGVGHAAAAMEHLKANGLDEVIKELRQPVLGICLGMQLLCSHTEEGNCNGLGVFAAAVRRFTSGTEKVPHTGWNTVQHKGNGLFSGITPGAYFYFVHSYYAPCSAHTVAETGYILPFSAALNNNNFYGTQFHPEKSGQAGEMLLANFLKH